MPKKDFARLDWYDVWFPVLAPSVATMKIGLAADIGQAMGSIRAESIAREMAAPAASQSLDVLALAATSRLL